MGNWKQKLKMRLPAITLLVVTILFWSLYERYESAGPILLSSPTLADAVRFSGEVSETDGRFVLNVPPAGKTARINFRIPDATNYSYIKVRARIKVDGVVVGKHYWSCARLVFAQYDAKDKWMPGHHGLMRESGTKEWEDYESVFEMFPGATYAAVALQQIGVEGSAEFEQIEALPVRLRASFGWWRILFLVLWISAAVHYFSRCRLNTRRLKVLILLNVIAILYGTLMPGEWISNTSDRVKEKIKEHRSKVVEEKVLSPAKPPRKIAEPKTELMEQFEKFEVESHQVGHFVLFASLCFLVYLSAALERQHVGYFAKVAFDILVFATITESLQFLTLDRTAGVSDLLTDVYGMATALILFLGVLPLVRRFQVRE